jgi:hypothetical protein
MATDDKKQYKTCLKLLSTTATGSSLANKLSDLSVDAGDPQLQQMAKGLADLVRPKLGEKDPKINILELASRWKRSLTPGHKQRGINIERMNYYCESAVQSAQPAWQIIALAQGWTPPASTKPE